MRVPLTEWHACLPARILSHGWESSAPSELELYVAAARIRQAYPPLGTHTAGRACGSPFYPAYDYYRHVSATRGGDGGRGACAVTCLNGEKNNWPPVNWSRCAGRVVPGGSVIHAASHPGEDYYLPYALLVDFLTEEYARMVEE